MSRAEMRREAREATKSNKTYNLNAAQVKAMKSDVTNKAIQTAFTLMVSIPVMVLHDKYGMLMKKEVDGKSREERFAEMILDLYDSYEKGYVALDDLKQCLFEETGMKMER